MSNSTGVIGCVNPAFRHRKSLFEHLSSWAKGWTSAANDVVEGRPPFGWSPRRRRAALLITYENGARHLYSDNDRPTERTDQERRDELTGCGALRGLSILLCQIPVWVADFDVISCFLKVILMWAMSLKNRTELVSKSASPTGVR